MSVTGVPSDAAELYDISMLLGEASMLNPIVTAPIHTPSNRIANVLSPNTRWNLLVFVFLVIAIQMGMRKNLKMILISISLMVQDVEHLFKCLLATCVSSENSLFSSWVHLLIG